MALTREKKESILKTLKEKIKQAKIVIFVNFHGLNVSAVQEIRRAMRKIGGEYLVAKKTLLKKALEEFNFKDKRVELEGEMGLVFGDGENAISASKQLRDFSRGHKLRILGGILENKYIDEAVVRQLAEIPSREILLGQLVRAVVSPLQQLVGVLQAPMRDLILVLNEIRARH